MGRKFSTSMPIGETATGLPNPVFFDPHYSIRTNKPPVTLVTGSPGAGKTVASLLLAAHSAILNKTTFILDPKGDFLSLKLLERAGEIENVHVWSIFQDIEKGTVREDNVGMLDPTRITDDVNENASLTLETINILVKTVSANQRNALIPIIQDVVSSKSPSMNNIRMILSRSRDPEISTLSHELGLALNMPAGKLLVGSGGETNRLRLDKGVVVASLMGLSMPASGKREESYSEKERLSVAIMRLLTHLVLDVMKKVPKTINKTLFIDEAWAVFNNEAGKDLIEEVALLGRSLNMAVVLATQSPAHVQGKKGEANLDTTISTRFAFRNTSDADNKITTKAMDLPEDAGYESAIRSLGNGQCLMKDSQEQFSFLDILLPEGWLEIFDTTPSPKDVED